MRNLRDSDYFIVNVDRNNNVKIIYMGRGGGEHQPITDDSQPVPDKKLPDFRSNETRLWMAGFIRDENMYEKQFAAKHNGIKYVFDISTINYGNNGKYYLISYIPELEDNRLIYMVFIVGLAFIVISFIVAKIVANYLSRPLKELENYTARIARKDWKEPIEVKSRDEIGRLGDAMNRMQVELKRADEEEKLFLQSISHDLKTPVMVISSHAEAIIDGVYIDSVEKTAEIIRDEAVSLEKKVKQLLYLNTLGYSLDNNSPWTEIRLRDLISSIISRFEAVNSKIDWELDMEELSILGNEDKIKVAVENILDNGLRYAKEKIKISLKSMDGRAVLDIYNDGPCIDNIHMGHIFDHFYKDKTGNFGLGLAISRKIIGYYRGKVEAFNRDKGVSFVISFPVSNTSR
jgi:two-component system sensor histidine kinase CssS